MSFGFSVGDFIAVGKLIADITSSLKEIGGSKSVYRDVVLELECLQKALVHLDRLPPQGNSQNVDSIKYAALSCKRPLEEFLAKLKRYEASLGPRATAGRSWKASFDKARFMTTQSGEIYKMQSYLSVHVGTLNILLAEYGLETMSLAQEKTAADQVDIRERIETTKGVLVQVRDSVAKQAAAVYNTAALLEKLYNVVGGEIRASWKSLEGMVAAACVSTQQIYSVVIEIRGALLSRPDTRWTFLQDPILVEDALGRKFIVPSEYDFALLNRIIQHKFEAGPGSTQVSQGDYQIMDARDRGLVLPSQSHLRPGSSLIMAILIGKPPPGILTDRACPMPHCASDKTTEAEGGGRICCICGIWFSETHQKRKSLLDLWAAVQESFQTQPTASRPVSSTLKRTSGDDPDLDIGGPSRKRQKSAVSSGEADFKYVKLADIEGPDSRDSILSLENDHEGPRVYIQTGASSSPVLDDALKHVDENKVVSHKRQRKSRASNPRPQTSSSSEQQLPSSNQSPRKRQASSSPVGERSGLRQKPSDSKQQAPDPKIKNVAFPTVPGGPARPQPQPQPQHYNLADLRSLQPHLPAWSQDPLSADSAPALLGVDLGFGTAAAGWDRWSSTTGLGSMFFPDGSIWPSPETLLNPVTPLLVRGDTDPAFNSSLPGPDQGGLSVVGHRYRNRWQPLASCYTENIELDSSFS